MFQNIDCDQRNYMIGLALRGVSFHCNWLAICARHSSTIRDPSCLRFPVLFPLTAACFSSMISCFHFLLARLLFYHWMVNYLINKLINWLLQSVDWLVCLMDGWVWLIECSCVRELMTRLLDSLIDWSMTLLVSALQEIPPRFIWRTPKRKLPDNSWRRSWCFRGYPQLL